MHLDIKLTLFITPKHAGVETASWFILLLVVS